MWHTFMHEYPLPRLIVALVLTGDLIFLQMLIYGKIDFSNTYALEFLSVVPIALFHHWLIKTLLSLTSLMYLLCKHFTN